MQEVLNEGLDLSTVLQELHQNDGRLGDRQYPVGNQLAQAKQDVFLRLHLLVILGVSFC